MSARPLVGPKAPQPGASSRSGDARSIGRLSGVCHVVRARESPQMSYLMPTRREPEMSATANTPASSMRQSRVETRLGVLGFDDGAPSAATAEVL
jgi:hypothetical protein